MIERKKAVTALAAVLARHPEREDWVPLAQALGLFPYEAWDTSNSERTTRGGARVRMVRMPDITTEDGEAPYEVELLPRIMGKVC